MSHLTSICKWTVLGLESSWLGISLRSQTSGRPASCVRLTPSSRGTSAAPRTCGMRTRPSLRSFVHGLGIDKGAYPSQGTPGARGGAGCRRRAPRTLRYTGRGRLDTSRPTISPPPSSTCIAIQLHTHTLARREKIVSSWQAVVLRRAACDGNRFPRSLSLPDYILHLSLSLFVRLCEPLRTTGSPRTRS